MRFSFSDPACRRAVFLLLLFTFSTAILPQSSDAQVDDLKELRARAGQLVNENKPVEALPLFEKIVKADPSDADAQFYLGFSLLAKAANTSDLVDRKQLRIRARNTFIKAKELGRTENIVDAFIQSLPADGSEPPAFSPNVEANTAIEQAEKAFTEGKIDEALALYQKGLKLDPKNYHAALFSGDMYFRKNDYANAEIWYQKAIAINPDIETAHRYSASPLMKQGKYDQARDRYVEAFIVEPYSRFALNGLLQWGEITETPLRHPKFDLPEFKIGTDGKVNSKINVNPLADDGSMAWIGYVSTRTEWREKKFSKAFPNEKAYRHSLQEEAEALRSVVKIANELKGKNKNLDPQLSTLAKLDQDGLLEAFILMAIPDQGIAQDHAAYLKQNRDKLRQYVIKYVIGGGN